jgi:acetolactate synthase small subunit
VGYCLKVLAREDPGILLRVSNLLCRKGYEVERLSFGPGSAKGLSFFDISLRNNGREPARALELMSKLVEVVDARVVEPGKATA